MLAVILNLFPSIGGIKKLVYYLLDLFVKVILPSFCPAPVNLGKNTDI